MEANNPFTTINSELAEIKEALFHLKNFLKAPPTPSSLIGSDFVGQLTARQILSGSEKPISRPTFNKIRKDRNIRTYHSTDKRVVFSRQELFSIIQNSSK